MKLQWSLCDQDESQWNDYLLLLMKHYEELTLPYGFEMSLSFVGNPMLQGNALLARSTDDGSPVGVIGFVFGTGADDFEDRRICQAEAVYLRPEHRRTTAFASMLSALTLYLRTESPETERIQFWSPADRPDLRRLFTKFSVLVKTNEKDFGRIDLFHTTPVRLASYLESDVGK